jgi:ribosomal protein L11 methyltransferase
MSLQNGIFKGPYDDLYIYHIKGRVTGRDELVLGNSFIGNWVEDDFSFLFFSSVSSGPVSELLKSRYDLELIDDYHFTYEEWQGGGFTSLKIDNFLIIPPWEEAKRISGEIRIMMDPGVVFGTGLHPTTRDCLKAISYVRNYCSFKRVIDIGTGTGILAIASAFLDVKEVLAIDLNPLSVRTAKRNVKLNKLQDVVTVIEGQAEDFLGESADLVIANIHYSVIKRLLGRKGFLQKGHFILSGLMRSQIRKIRDMAAKQKMKILKEWDYEMTWHTILARKE